MQKQYLLSLLVVSAASSLQSGPLIDAITQKKDVTEVRHLLKKDSANPDEQDDRGLTALDHAIGGGATGHVKLLLECGADYRKLKLLTQFTSLSQEGVKSVKLVLAEQRKTEKALRLLLAKNGVLNSSSKSPPLRRWDS